jgi:LysM repeat protein
MQAILADPSPSLQQKADLLVEKANAQGGYDNITALLLAPPSKKANFALDMNLKLPPQKYLIGGGIALVALVLLILLFARKREAAPTAEKSDIIILTDDSTQVDTSLSSPPPLVEETGGEVITPSQGPMPVPSAPPTESPTVKPSRPTIAPSTPSSSSKTFTYTVQKGDNLTQIAKAFSVSREEVRRVNNLKDDDAIKAGQKLKIPVQALHTHTVGKGETLSAIARKYGTSTEAIRRANQIEDEKIRAGQKLTIPVVKK